jgi:GntR family transcriptional regulator/MocR family aminotransferase
VSVEGAGFGPDLLLVIDRDSAVGLRAQLEVELRSAIRSGRLRAGERVHSTRRLAAGLGVSRGVVEACYAQLQAEGYLTAQPGSATRVAMLGAAPHPHSLPEPAQPVARPIADLVPGVPDLGKAPREDWAWAVREACRVAPTASFDYGDARGEQTARLTLASYLGRVRALDTDADRIMVSAGFHQGLVVVLQALARQGFDCVAGEDPGFPETVRGAAAAAGLRAVPVPVDDRGIDVTALAATGARVVVVTPAHQWPTGVILTPERRQQLLAWSAERDGVIIEDDYDAEFRYDRSPVGALQGLAPDRVFALGTVSKSLAPAIRLGWIVAPPRHLDALVAAKFVADRGTSGIDQLALAELIRSGRYDRHLRRMRAEYASRRSALIAALAHHAPDVRVTGLAAGLHVVVHLPDHTSEADVVDGAARRGVLLSGMSDYRWARDARPPQIVLGFGNANPRAIVAGITAVSTLLSGSGPATS